MSETRKVQIPFGFNEKQERVTLPLFHTFFVAMTGHGKTVGMKSLLVRFNKLHPDWHILIIDSKDKRDYAGFNADVPVCFVETTEPLDLKSLLEPIVGANLMYYFDKIIEEAVYDTLGEVQRSINGKLDRYDRGELRMNGKEAGKLRVLNHLLKKLVKLVEQPNIASELKLREGFNVMPVSLPQVKEPALKRAFQQLIVRSTLVLLLSDPSLEKTLLVLDENHKWNPQRYSSICKQPLSEYASEGRSQDKMVWMSDQALTKIDKESLKNVKVWVVGQQMESNEVEDAVRAVNSITDLSVTDKEIKTLRIGSFILVDGLNRKVEKAYLQPYGVPDGVALEVLRTGNPDLAEPYIASYEKSMSQQEENDEVWKEKYEELRKQHLNEVAELNEKHGENMQKALDRVGKLEKQAEGFGDSLKNAESEGYVRGKAEAEESFAEDKKKIEALRLALRGFISPEPERFKPPQLNSTGIRSVELSHEEVAYSVKKTDSAVSLSTKTADGKVVYALLKLSGAGGEGGWSEAEVSAEMLEHGWNMGHSTLAPTLGGLVRDGLVVRLESKPARYRLPRKKRITAEDAAKS